MTRLTQENIVAGVVLVFLIGVLVISYQYGERARLVPVPIAITGILLTLLQIYLQNVRPAEDLHIDLLEVLAKDQVKKSDAPKPASEKSEPGSQLVGFGFVILALVLFLAIGPFLAIFLFMAGYLVVSRYSGIGLAALIAFALTAVLWALFVMVLKIQVYWGLLEPLALSWGV